MRKRFWGFVLPLNLLAVLFFAVGISENLVDLCRDDRLTQWLLPGWAVVCALAYGGISILGAIPDSWDLPASQRFQWIGTAVFLGILLTAIVQRIICNGYAPAGLETIFSLAVFSAVLLLAVYSPRARTLA